MRNSFKIKPSGIELTGSKDVVIIVCLVLIPALAFVITQVPQVFILWATKVAAQRLNGYVSNT